MDRLPETFGLRFRGPGSAGAAVPNVSPFFIRHSSLFGKPRNMNGPCPETNPPPLPAEGGAAKKTTPRGRGFLLTREIYSDKFPLL
jgi:hypothetical protein